MQIDVHDTYARTTDGELHHFDLLLPAGQVGNAEGYARKWLSRISLHPERINLKRCRYCHSESATPEIQQEILQRGYAIIRMAGCPAPINVLEEA